MKHIKQLVFIWLLFHANHALAHEWYGEFGFHAGGDSLTNVALAGDAGRSNVDAGEAMNFLIGGMFAVTENTHFIVGVGLRGNEIYGADSNIRWRMEEVKLGINYFIDRTVLGAGVSRFINPRLRGLSDGNDISMDFNDTNALTANLSYQVYDNWLIGLVYTHTTYRQIGTQQSFDGSSIGLRFTLLE